MSLLDAHVTISVTIRRCMSIPRHARFLGHLTFRRCLRPDIMLTYAVIPLELVSLARYRSPGLSSASGFEHPASTLPTRFPAALGIGHVLPAA